MDFFDKLTKAIAEIGIPAALSGGLLLIVGFAAKALIKGHLKFLAKIEVCIDQLVKLNKKSYNVVKKSDSTLAKVENAAHDIKETTEEIQKSTQKTQVAVDLMLKNQLPRRQ